MLGVFVSGTQLHQFGGSLPWNCLTEINDCTAIQDQLAVRNKINMTGMPHQKHVENDCCRQASRDTNTDMSLNLPSQWPLNLYL